MGFDITRPDPRIGGPGSDTLPFENPSQEAKDDATESYFDAVYGQSDWVANDYQDLNADVSAEKELIDNILAGTGADVSLSDYLRDNPGLNAEDYLRYMSEHSDEWAEKYIDYMLEKESLDAQNKYSANREDTAYQRLVEDLKKAGLNPALMYGSSASPSASNSLGYLKQNEGANSRSVGNFAKLKNLLIGIMAYELGRKLDTTDQIFKSGKDFSEMLHNFVHIFTVLSA